MSTTPPRAGQFVERRRFGNAQNASARTIPDGSGTTRTTGSSCRSSYIWELERPSVTKMIT
jgi:hypothetical protein